MASVRQLRHAPTVAIVLALACGSRDDAATAADDTDDGTTAEPSGSSEPSTSASTSSTGALDESTSASDESSSTGEPPTECPEPPAEPPCAATGDGRCFYIDPEAGDDMADGSASAPWRTFVNVDSSIYYGTYPAPPQWVELQKGDVVYVGEGTIADVFHPGDDSGPEGGGSYIVYFRGLAGTTEAPITITRLPGTRPILAPASAAIGILVQQSSGIVVDGFEVRGAWGRGIRIEESQDVAVAHVLVYDTDGTAADNVAGLEILGSTDVEVTGSVFADNYDRAAAEAGNQTGNSGNLVMFSNDGSIAIRGCAFYQSGGPDSQFSGFGVKYKHAGAFASSFELVDSYVEGAWFGVGIGTAHALVHHNVIVDSGTGITSEDFGGPTHQWDQRYVANTIVAEVGFWVSPSLDWIDEDGEAWPDVTENAFERNIVVDTSAEQIQDARTVLFDPYMSDERYDALAHGIGLDENCYHREAGPASFGFAESTSYGEAGGAFDLAGWRAATGFDGSSVEADPGLAAHVPAADGPCAEQGAFTDEHAPAIDLADPLACGDATTVRRWER